MTGNTFLDDTIRFHDVFLLQHLLPNTGAVSSNMVDRTMKRIPLVFVPRHIPRAEASPNICPLTRAFSSRLDRQMQLCDNFFNYAVAFSPAFVSSNYGGAILSMVDHISVDGSDYTTSGLL